MSLTVVDPKRLLSKAEQGFWDKAFLAALGRGNKSTGYLHEPADAGIAADKAIAERRSREAVQEHICQKVFGLAGQFTCKRIKGHKGRCQDY